MLSSTLDRFFAVAVYVERGGGRRRFSSVFHDFTPDNCLKRLNAGAVRIVGTAGMVQVVENPRGSGRVRQGGVISAVAVGHRQAALAVMCRG